jgi:hypothetical protein
VLDRVYKGLQKEPPKVEEEIDLEEDEYGEEEDIDIDLEDEG